MTSKELKALHNEIAKAIQINVNGKIDAIREDLNKHAAKDEANMATITAHMDAVKPYIEGIAGVGLLSKAFIGLGAVAIAYISIKNLLHIP